MSNELIQHYLKKASQNGFAIPHFNFNDCWDLQAIVEAADEMRTPIFVASVMNVCNTLGIDLAVAMTKAVAARAKVPVFLHMDHSSSVELCGRCIEAGYDSVMIDSSAKSLEENIADTNTVIAMAAARGVHVEAEIGRIRGRDEGEGTYLGKDYLVQVADAKALVDATNVDALAIGIGTQHGFYRGKPELNFQRLSEVHRAIETPLVLHGGTGIPEEDVRHAIQLGISKVNIGTIIRYTYMKGMREEIERVGPAVHPGLIVAPVREQIKSVVRSAIQMCMSENTAE